MLESLFSKVSVHEDGNFIKSGAIFCEIWEVSKSIYFAGYLQTDASESVGCWVNTLLFELRLEEEEENKNYLCITPECFDELLN